MTLTAEPTAQHETIVSLSHSLLFSVVIKNTILGEANLRRILSLTLLAQYAEHGLWNCRASVRVSVCLSVRPSNHSPAAAAFGEFAAERRAGEKCRSTASGAGCPPAAAPQRGQQHGAQQQTRAVSRLQRTYEAVRRLVITAPPCYATVRATDADFCR